MEQKWLFQENRDSLIIFCNGWGMDEKPFKPLGSTKYDVLVCYDYTNESGVPDVEELVSKYSELILIGWSIGVAYGQRLFSEKSHYFNKTIAINGTLCPIHDTFGIPVEVFEATLSTLRETSLLKFYHRVCRTKKVFHDFLLNKPERTIESQIKELNAISRCVGCTGEDKSIYADVVVSQKDLVIPTENQMRFWQSGATKLISGHHFPFYQWKSWDNVVEYTEK